MTRKCDRITSIKSEQRKRKTGFSERLCCLLFFGGGYGKYKNVGNAGKKTDAVNGDTDDSFNGFAGGV